MFWTGRFSAWIAICRAMHLNWASGFWHGVVGELAVVPTLHQLTQRSRFQRLCSKHREVTVIEYDDNKMGVKAQGRAAMNTVSKMPTIGAMISMTDTHRGYVHLCHHRRPVLPREGVYY